MASLQPRVGKRAVVVTSHDARNWDAVLKVLEVDEENGLQHDIMREEVPEAPDEEVRELFLTLWHKAGIHKDYDKKQWTLRK